MRIHRIVLRNFRGVVESTVTFPETGVTIIEGDNEVGKSCIAESIDLVLNVPDSATSQKVRSIRPVHRDEGAEVEIEMSTGPYRFVLVKRWHRQRKTELAIIEPKRENLVGRDAHDRVKEMLAETLDEQLFTALRLEQGVDLRIPGFDVPSLGRALDLALGGEQGGDREDDLFSRITAERERYWTPTGLRKGERDQLAAQLSAARAEVDAAEEQLRHLEAAAVQVEQLRGQARVVTVNEAEQSRLETDLAQRWESIERRQGALRLLASDHEAAVARLDRSSDESVRRNALLAEVEAARARLAALVDESSRAQPELAAVRQRSDELHLAVAGAKRALVDAERGYRLACDDRDHRRGEIEIAQLTERSDRVLDAQRRLTLADATLEAARVDREMLAAIEAAQVRVLQAEAAAAHGASQVELTSLDGSAIEVDGDLLTLVAGAVEQRVVADVIEIVVPGVARVHVSAGGDARAAAERLAEAHSVLRQLCMTAAVADLAEARQAVARRDEAERVSGEATASIRQDLRDLTLESLTAKIERLGGRLRDYIAERATETRMPVDLDQAQLVVHQIGDELDDRRVEFQRCEELAAAVSAELQLAQHEGVSLRARVEQFESTLAQVEVRLADDRERRADDQLGAELAAAAVVVAAAAAALDEARAALASDDPETVADLLQNARDARRRAANELLELNESRLKLEVELEVKGEQGLAELLGDAERQVAHLQIEHDRLESRAEAARVLYAAFATRRDEARDRYLAPFQNKIERLGKLVFGPTFEVTLDRELRLATRTLDGVTLDVEQLSVGAREQLAILSRLACAALVSGDGGAPVILDDALGWTDPSRLDRMGAALAVAARDCQIIVLTCTPGRYQSVGSASVVRLNR